MHLTMQISDMGLTLIIRGLLSSSDFRLSKSGPFTLYFVPESCSRCLKQQASIPAFKTDTNMLTLHLRCLYISDYLSYL